MSPADVAPSWSEFFSGLELFAAPMLCGGVAGLALGYIGLFIVLRRMVFVSAAITHSAGLGVALSYYAQIHLGATALANGGHPRLLGPLLHALGAALAIDPLLSAFVFGVGCTLLLAIEPRRLRLTRESLIGLVFIFASAAALLVGDRIAQESHDIHAILFGTAVMVSRADLVATLVTAGVVLALQLWLRRGLLCVAFDEPTARVQRLPVRLLSPLMLLSIGVLVSVTTRAIGAMPVFAFSVLPAIAALGLGLRVGPALAAAAGLGALCAVAGYVLSFFLRFPVGACQAILAALCAGLGLLLRLLRR